MNETWEERDWRLLLSPAERAAMLTDIARVSLAVGARLFPEASWSAFGVSLSDAGPKSPMEQIAFIEALLPALGQTLAQIAQSPLTAARSQDRPTLPILARRVTAAAWMQSARQPRRVVAEIRTEVSHDTPENRAVRSFLDVLARDCAALTRLAAAEEETGAAARAMASAEHLRRMAGADWLDEATLRRGAWTRAPTAREAARPDYASLARARAAYRRQFQFDWDTPALALTPRETWRLYETWCLLTTLDALRGLGWQAKDPQEWLAVREGRLLLTLAVGAASRITLRSVSGRTLSLTYNQTFAEGRESLSHTMTPDITLTDGERLWILDAKFKPYALPGEEGGDINQMHAYRDAIVGPSGRTVAAAWCLYAGLTDTPNRPHLTYGRPAADAPVGALGLRPGDSGSLIRLRGLLAEWLEPLPKTAGRSAFPGT